MSTDVERARYRAYNAKRKEKTAAYNAEYRIKNREKLREYNRTYQAKWEAEHLELKRLMRRASAAVNRAVRAGKIVKPTSCSWCGASERAIRSAHRDYEWPYLNIVWLCQPCHVRWDLSEPKLIRKPVTA